MDQDRLTAGQAGVRRLLGEAPSAPRARLAVEVLLALLLAVQGVRIALDLRQPSPAASVAASAPAAPVDLSILTRFDPFSSPAAAGHPGTESAASSLRLFGVQQEGDSSVAIVGFPDGRQATVGLGEEVEPGLMLRSVGEDHVVLLRDGIPQRLDFAVEGPPGARPLAPPDAQGAPSPPAYMSGGRSAPAPVEAQTTLQGAGSRRLPDDSGAGS